MTKEEISQHLQDKIKPVFEELGIEGFVMVGYVNSGDGELKRLMLVQMSRNAAVQDGLRPVLTFGRMWSLNDGLQFTVEREAPRAPQEGGSA